jgi:hypothetical protein
MRVFWMVRDYDETGISGTGIVAEGVEFDDGKVVIRWQTHESEHHSTVVWDDIASVRAIHGHNGKTWLQFADLIGWPPEGEHNDPAELQQQGHDRQAEQ